VVSASRNPRFCELNYADLGFDLDEKTDMVAMCAIDNNELLLVLPYNANLMLGHAETAGLEFSFIRSVLGS
jgi:hypothetical protein